MVDVRFPIQSKFRFIDDRGRQVSYTNPELHLFLLQLSERIGGTSEDFISQIQEDILALTPIIIVASANTTTSKSTNLIASASITVFLNPSPNDGEIVIVKRFTSDGNVTVDGNGKNIDSGTTYTMLINNESRKFSYVSSLGGWFII